MTNIVFICYMSGNVFNEIKYNDFDELYDKLKLMIIQNDTDILMKLLINDEILNEFDIIDISILSKLNKHTCITVILSDKKNYIV